MATWSNLSYRTSYAIACSIIDNNYMSVVRILCYICRFKTKCRGQVQQREWKESVLAHARCLQRKMYPKIYSGLSQKNYIVKNSKLKSHILFIDDDGLIELEIVFNNPLCSIVSNIQFHSRSHITLLLFFLILSTEISLC